MADSFWNVIGDVANTAAQDIGRYRQQKFELSQQHKEELRRQAIEQARREREDRSYGLQREQFGETQRHNQAVESNQGLRAQGNAPNTIESAYLRALEAGDTTSANEFRGLLTSQDRFRGPEPKIPPNYIEDIITGAESDVSRNASIRQNESNTAQIDPTTGKLAYRGPTTPPLTLDAAKESRYNRVKGGFPRYSETSGLNAGDSIRMGVGLQPTQTQQQGLMPQRGAPSSNMGDFRRMEGPRGSGLQPQQRQRRQFNDGSVAELNPETGQWEVIQ